jgi:hypothetical protein
MGVACGTYGGQEMHRGFLRGDLMERDHLEDLGLYGMIILKCIFKNLVEELDEIALAQDRKSWWAPV